MLDIQVIQFSQKEKLRPDYKIHFQLMTLMMMLIPLGQRCMLRLHHLSLLRRPPLLSTLPLQSSQTPHPAVYVMSLHPVQYTKPIPPTFHHPQSNKVCFCFVLIHFKPCCKLCKVFVINCKLVYRNRVPCEWLLFVKIFQEYVNGEVPFASQRATVFLLGWLTLHKDTSCICLLSP